MKFRALISNPAALREFMNVSQSISKLSKECVLRISDKKLYLIVSSDDAGPRRPFVWCELLVNFYFVEYTLVGINEAHNEIYLGFNTGMLAKALLSLKQNVKSVKIKLTNKMTPCLTINIDQIANLDNVERQCIHDVPVEVIPVEQWQDYTEPTFTDFHVSIQMPNLKSIRNIVERMKTVSSSLIVSANKNGRLTIKIKTNMVTLSAHFPDLSVQSFAVGQIPTIIDETNLDEERENETVTAVIDAKKFLTFLTGMQLTNCRTVCSIVQGQMVKLSLEQPGSLSLQCFLTELSL